MVRGAKEAEPRELGRLGSGARVGDRRGDGASGERARFGLWMYCKVI